jgi:hypothetical protein
MPARKKVAEVGNWPIDIIRVGNLSVREAEALIDAASRALDGDMIDRRKRESTQRAVDRLRAEVEPIQSLLKDYRRYRKQAEANNS